MANNNESIPLYKWVVGAIGSVMIIVAAQLLMRAYDGGTKRVENIQASYVIQREKLGKAKLQIKELEAWKDGVEQQINDARGHGFHDHDAKELKDELVREHLFLRQYMLEQQERLTKLRVKVGELKGCGG